MNQKLFLSITFIFVAFLSNAQYQQPERDDTVRIFSQLPFDTAAAANALGRGNCTIKGVVFTRAHDANTGKKALYGNKIYANKTTVTLYPVTPYLLDFLDLKRKKQNVKKLHFVYLSNEAYYYRLTAITNSTGDFTFPNLKPGKYYLEAVVGSWASGTYNKPVGSVEDGYGGATIYQSQNFTNNYYDLVKQFVEIQNEGQTLDIKLK